MIVNPNDRIREKVLQLFYETSKTAHHENQHELNEHQVENRLQKDGVNCQDISSAIIYLLDSGFLKKRVVTTKMQNYMRISGGPKDGYTIKTTHYRISSKGVDEIDGGSRFGKQSASPTHITAGDGSFISVGNQNTISKVQINNRLKDLEELRSFLLGHGDLSEADKENIKGDVSAIQAQLGKVTPSTGIISAAWKSLESFATIAGAIDFFNKAKILIGPFL